MGKLIAYHSLVNNAEGAGARLLISLGEVGGVLNHSGVLIISLASSLHWNAERPNHFSVIPHIWRFDTRFIARIGDDYNPPVNRVSLGMPMRDRNSEAF